MRSGTVFSQEAPAGTIRETDRGYEFQYLPEWLANPEAEPVSLTLPLTERVYVVSDVVSLLRRADSRRVAA